MMNAADIAKQADTMLAEKELEMKELEAQKRRARDIMFKKTQQLTKMMDTETEIKMEIHGANTGIKNLSSRMKKLDQESIKSQEIIYNQDFNIAQLERRIARMQGEVNNEEKQGMGIKFFFLICISRSSHFLTLSMDSCCSPSNESILTVTCELNHR